MTPSARLQAVFELLSEIAETPRPADAIVSKYFRARRYIGSKDRNAVASMLYDALRHRARLEWWLKKVKSPKSDAREHLLAYLALVGKVTAKQVDTLFDGKKFSPKPLSDNERAMLQKLAGHTIESPDMRDAVKTECPDWAAASLKQRFGKSFQREMRALLEEAPLDLRVNTLKANREDVLAELHKTGIKAEACSLSPWGIRIEGRPSISALPMFREGLIEIQDEGSQLLALLVDAKPGQRVVDFCAGAGGKTLAIAAQMKNKGRIIACDVLAGRLKRSSDRFRRAGLHNVEIKPLTSEHDPWVKRHKAGFDRVLVDAPCTGIGAWRRNPDSRWRSLGPGLENLVELQASILESAARLVRKKGRIIYATCSLLPEENEQQIEKFLKKHPEFHLVDGNEILGEIVQNRFLTLTPAQHGTDGFFGGILENRANSPAGEPDKSQ